MRRPSPTYLESETMEDENTPTGEVDITPEISEETLAAKIAQLEATIVGKDEEIAALTTELAHAKAHNYDLLISVPTEADEVTTETEEDSAPDFEDFFNSEDE